MADMESTDLAQDRDMWQTIAKMVNCGFDKMWRVFLLAKELSASQEGLYCIELSSQSFSWLPIIKYLVYFPCIYWTSLVLVHTQTQNTHLAFLHNTKYSFQSLYYNSRIVTAWSCRCSVNVTEWLTGTWHSSTLLVSVSERKHTDHILVIKHATLYTVTHAHFYQALTGNSATIKCEQQYKHKPVRCRNMATFI
jgi:hypothetical protein